ncbi:MAG: tyrosine-protein phosphatase, partial [Pseudomonadota bacterium]|nr:tyrosine-protein phosphatase [Pseudomonadota bacterium]
KDYLLTNTLTAASTEIRKKNLKERLERDIADDLLDAVMKVQADYLNAGFERIHEEYGSVESFLKEGLELGSVEIEELQRRYLTED